MAEAAATRPGPAAGVCLLCCRAVAVAEPCCPAFALAGVAAHAGCCGGCIPAGWGVGRSAKEVPCPR